MNKKARRSNQTISESCTNSKYADKTLKDYEVISIIGNGIFGTCFKVRDKKTGVHYAWKSVDYEELNEAKERCLVSGINDLRKLKHSHIVQYYHHLVNHEAKLIFIVMEYCEGGDLSELIIKARSEHKRFEEPYIWRVLFQICSALQMCYDKIKIGTIRHTYINPANIFLDVDGNVKLGDFGLTEIIRDNENSSEHSSATASKYDCKSDVWALGYLIYEMCVLHLPLKRRATQPQALNTFHGKFTNIPNTYSADLQKIIAIMLEVDNKLRPSIDLITEHTIVMRNMNGFSNEYPKLVEDNPDFCAANNSEKCCDPLTDLSSTMCTEKNSFNEEYRQRRLSFNGDFTPDVHHDLSYSVKSRKYTKHMDKLSDSELCISFRNDAKSPEPCKTQPGPNTEWENYLSAFTQNFMDQTVQERLNIIHNLSGILAQKEASLLLRERELDEREKHIQILERSWREKLRTDAKKSKNVILEPVQKFDVKRSNRTASLNPSNKSGSKQSTKAPPILPRYTTSLDDTYCSIESNDTLLQQPTVAKLNMADMPAAKAFSTLRRVTFRSPQKCLRYDIENVRPKSENNVTTKSHRTTHNKQRQQRVANKGSEESGTGDSVGQWKSIFSMFGLNRSSKDVAKITITHTQSIKEVVPWMAKVKDVFSKCETTDLTNVWTKEQKRAAFDMLAAMNARHGDSSQQASRPKIRRQTVRERNASHSNRLRRSLIN